MKLIILAAGRGTRLAPITEKIPKCMVKLKEKPLILWNIEAAQNVGIKDIIVISGYKGEELEFLKEYGVKLIDNPMYETTNMVETLFIAREYFDSEFIVSYGDIIYEEEILKKIIESKNDISVVVDHGWEQYWKMRNEDIFSDAESLVLDGDRIINIGQKVNEIKYIQGQYIGLLKFKDSGVKALKDIYDKEKKAFSKNENYICKYRKLNEIYMTDVIQGLIDKGYKVNECAIFRKWLEIDNINDLILAEKLSEIYEDKIKITE